jgi:ATP-binding cassette subfamily B protein
LIVGPEEAGWPASRLGDLLCELGARTGGLSERVENPPSSFDGSSSEKVGLWLETAGEWMGVEVDAAQVSYPEVESFLETGGPAILRVRAGRELRFVALLGFRRGRLRLLVPDAGIVKLPVETVRAWLCARVEDPLDGEVRAFLRDAGVSPRREEKARQEILRQRLSSTLLGAIWMVRTSTASDFRRQLRRAGVVSRVVALCFCHAFQYALFLLSWWIIGRGALQGRADPGWLTAWFLLLLSLVPLRMATAWLQAGAAVRAGALLKRRLMAGALRLVPEEIRSQGAGQLLGRVLESEALESMALGGGFLLLLGSIELSMAGWVLARGAGGLLHVALLAGWTVATGIVGWLHYSRRRAWTVSRLELTHRLIEKMLGYRTRLVQESRALWHEEEDGDLAAYARGSLGMDRVATLLMAVAARGWLVVGVLLLASSMAGADVSMTSLGIAIGGVLLAYRALVSVASGMGQLFAALVAWRTMGEIFRAGARQHLRSSPSVAVSPLAEKGCLLEAREVGFTYPGRSEPVLSSFDFEVQRGERVLVQGPSGSGKSTLAALLAGLRRPSSGLLLLGGLDQQSTGLRRWRRSVVLAPQFHENHILSESLAFNLLMGRRWPALPADLAEAEDVCRALGLGELLDRMPGGLFQMVGETGWQLSHGERNRVYLARTLLQNEGLTVLDECFEPLDSANALRANQLVLERVPSVVAIAHA